jgi:SMC interacting uncharacterized protein involved in chromosome segregation
MTYQNGNRIGIAKSVALKAAVEIVKSLGKMSKDTAECFVDYFTAKYFRYLMEDDDKLSPSSFIAETVEGGAEILSWK